MFILRRRIDERVFLKDKTGRLIATVVPTKIIPGEVEIGFQCPADISIVKGGPSDERHRQKAST